MKDDQLRKKLRPNARIEFAERRHTNIIGLGQHNQVTLAAQMTGLLVSQAFLDDLYRKPKFWLFFYADHVRIYHKCYKHHRFYAENYFQMVSIISLYKPKAFSLVLDTEGPKSLHYISNFIRLCKTINDTLIPEQIYIDIRYYDPVLVSIMADLLPDKIVHIQANFRILRHIITRQSIMDGVEIFNSNSYLDYALIFKVKAKAIYLCGEHKLIDIFKFDNLQPNPIIEEFHTRADFNLPVDGDESTDVDKWSEKCLPKYRRVFNCLKSVNPAIVLILSATYYHRDLTLNAYIEVVKHLKSRSNNIHAFIDLATEMAIKIKTILIRDYFYVNVNDEEFVQFKTNPDNKLEFDKTSNSNFGKHADKFEYKTTEVSIITEFSRRNVD